MIVSKCIRTPHLTFLFIFVIFGTLTEMRAVERSGPVEASLSANVDGKTIEVALTIVIDPHWHVYARERGADGQHPLEINLNLPDGIEYSGDWIWPKPETIFSGGEPQVYEGTQTFKCRLKVTTAQGEVACKAIISFQACNAQMCRSPETLEVSARLRVTQDPKTAARPGCLEKAELL